MKMQHLKFFVAVVHHGGVIKAAEHLHLSQPAVSAGLKALERDLGKALFDRSRGTRQLRLTSQGQRFHLRALAILKECDAARAEFLGEEQPKRRFRLGVLETLPQAFVTAMLDALRVENPQHAIELWEGEEARLAGWMGQDRVDAAVTVVAGVSHNVRVLWHDPIMAVVAPTHVLAKSPRRTITMQELAGEPYVFRSRCELSTVGAARLRAAGTTPRVVVKAERDELAFHAVAQGVGLTLVPRSIVPPNLVSLTVSGLSLARTVGLQWHPDLDPEFVDNVYRAAMAASEVLPLMKRDYGKSPAMKTAMRAALPPRNSESRSYRDLTARARSLRASR